MNKPEKKKQARRVLAATALRPPRLVVTTGIKASLPPAPYGSLKSCMDDCLRDKWWQFCDAQKQCPYWCNSYMRGYPFFSPSICPKNEAEWQRLLRAYEISVSQW